MIKRLFLSGVVALACLGTVVVSQLAAQEPIDGRNRIFNDDKWTVFAEDTLRQP